MKSGLLRGFLWIGAIWSVLACLLGLVLWSGLSGLDARKLRFDTIELLRQSGAEHAPKANYVESMEVVVQRAGFVLFVTGAGLLVASIHGLRRRPALQPPAA